MEKRAARKKRHERIRNKIIGTPETPRMSVYRSLNNIYVQLIDDFSGNTLVAASTKEPALSEKIENGGNKEAARMVGQLVAERARDKGIKSVVFDRCGYKYHGRLKEVAEAARKQGLNF